MKARVGFFFKYLTFWFLFGQLARIIFFIYQHPFTRELSISDLFFSMLHGARLDLTIAGYFTLLPGLLTSISAFGKGRLLKYFITAYTAILLLVTTFIVILDLELYRHWGFRMDATPLLYVGDQATASSDASTIVLLIFGWLLLCAGTFWCFFQYIRKDIGSFQSADWKTALLLLILTAALIGPIRGTVGVAPINTGTVYHHKSNMFANHAAINVIYNFGYAIRKINRLKYPENYFDREKTTQYFNELITQDTSNVSFVNGEQPNIILIVLESFTFRLIEPLGGVPDVTPNLNKLAAEGILFDNFYASGDRTDIGMVSIMNGYPRQPKGSIIKFPKKTATLPYINKTLSQRGYYTGFTFGNDIDFANFNSYLSNAQFNHLMHADLFPDELNDSKWGVHDHYVFDEFLNELNKAPQPFFKVMLTLSSHQPYTVPMETVIEGNDDSSKFLNSAHYTDKSLGTFIADAKKQSWWNNTWIIITADHGHPLPDNHGVANPRRFKIPMLWLGGAVAKQDTVIHRFGTQTDLANTIFGQLGFQDEAFTFSSNMLSKHHKPFSLFIFNDGVGYLDSLRTIVYDNTAKAYVQQTGATNGKDLALAKAYLQQLYSDFNKR